MSFSCWSMVCCSFLVLNSKFLICLIRSSLDLYFEESLVHAINALLQGGDLLILNFALQTLFHDELVLDLHLVVFHGDLVNGCIPAGAASSSWASPGFAWDSSSTPSRSWSSCSGWVSRLSRSRVARTLFRSPSPPCWRGSSRWSSRFQCRWQPISWGNPRFSYWHWRVGNRSSISIFLIRICDPMIK